MHSMNAQLFCGLDVHRSGSSYAAIVDERGELVKERKLSNDSIPEFIGSYRPTRIAMEASSSITSIYRGACPGRDSNDVLVSHPEEDQAHRGI